MSDSASKLSASEGAILLFILLSTAIHSSDAENNANSWCVMSGSYPRLLKRRAEAMLRNATRLLEEGEYDLAVLNAEYAAQLYVKAVLYQLTGEEWRGHSIHSLLGVLAYTARENGLDQLADKIFDFIKRNRRILAELDEVQERAVYRVFEYTRSQAETILDSSRQVINLVREIDRILE